MHSLSTQLFVTFTWRYRSRNVCVSLQPMRLWTGKQVIGLLLRPNKRSPILLNMRVKGKLYSSGEELCCNDSCRDL